MLQRSCLAPPVRETEGEGQVPALVHEVFRSPGKPLNKQTRDSFQPHFGHDFSRIPTYTSAAGVIQTKPAISEPGDSYEQEADRVAGQVMAAPAHQTVSGTPPHIQRFSGQSGGEADFAPASVDRALASPGRPLEPALRHDMEQHFGHDFSRVRVHSGAAAEQSAQDVNADAYTVGPDIVFGADWFAPWTHEGGRLIAHELTHVIQQRAATAVESRGSGVSVSRNVQHSGMSMMVLQRQVKDPRKLQVISVDTPRHVRVSEWLVESKPGGGSERTEIYWVDFKVDAKGLVTASVKTVSSDRAYRSGVLRFGDEFRRALEHFSKSGVEVTAFEGDWSYMSKDEISENLRAFQEGLAQGLSREKAARGTPTGKVAARSGFEVTNVENVLESQPHLAEEGVRRWRVKAIFRRPPLAPVTPPAKAWSGEITPKATPPPKSGPPATTTKPAPTTMAPTGGTETKTEPLRTPGGPPAPTTERVTTAYKGEPVEAIHNPADVSAKGGLEFGAQVLLAAQLSSVRGAEAAKAATALENLGPQIDKLRSEGNGVTITLVVEVPNQVDIAAIWAGIGDPGQVVYFKKMYISQITPAKKSGVVSTQTTMSANLAPGDPEQQDPHEWTLQQQIRAQMGEKYPVPGTGPRKGFYFSSRELFLPAFMKKPGGRTREESGQLRGIAGTYGPKFEALFSGSVFMIPTMMMRRLQIEQDAGGKLVPKMWKLSEPYVYDPYVVHEPMVLSGRFTRGKGLPPASEWIMSSMEYPREGLILEWVKGLDSGLNIVWDALFSWRKI